MRKFLHLVLFVVLSTAGLNVASTGAQAADTGNTAPQNGKIVSDEPGKNAPNILDGTVNSIAKVGNVIVVGGSFTQAQNYNTQATLTRRGVLAYDATTGKISTTFAPDPDGTVYKVLPAADGTSVYVAGGFENAAGTPMPGRVFKMDVNSGALDPAFKAPFISGTIRDLEVVGNRLWIAGKFTHINGAPQLALGTINALTGKRDPFMGGVFAGLHNSRANAVTAVIQISVNKQNTRLMAVGNFTTVDGLSRHQIVQLDITGAAPVVTNWSTNMYTQECSSSFETYLTDVEYSPNGQFFVVSTTGAYGGLSGSMAGTSGCDMVARFESSSEAPLAAASWTAYTGGDTTWTVEVTNNVVYAGGHQRWQNNPGAADKAGQGAVSRDGIAALNTQNGLPYSWNPTRARGVGVQDMLATSEGLYVGSDTELIGHTVGNTYHARIAILPLATGATLPQLQTNNVPVDLYRVSSSQSQLTKRSFSGTTVGTSSNVASGPGWGTSTGAFMVNGVLYKTNSDGSLSRMTFNGSAYGAASAVNTSDALVLQSDWHNDAKTITSIFYADGFIYYTLSGQNALYRRGFEVESGIVGQQRFSTTTTSINYSQVRGAFVAGGRMFYATSAGNLWSIAWNQAARNVVTGTGTQLTLAGTGWASRALFPYQAVPGPFNEAPLAAATISCDQLVCTNDGTGSTDPEAGALSYDWDFGDGTPHVTTATATHTYADAGNRPVTLTVTDNLGATSSVTKTASPAAQPDNISFVAKSSTNGNRSSHTVSVPTGTQWGDTLLLFFSSNSTVPVYTGPAGWQEVLSQSGSSFVGRVYSKTATAGDFGSSATVTSKNTDGTSYLAKSDTTMVAYRGVGAPVVRASGVTTQDIAGTVHQTPTVSSPDGTSWLVSYWTDKSSLTTSWTGPATETQRSLGVGTGASHMSSLLMDSDGRVNGGAQGGLNATANSSAQGLTMSVLLNGGTPPSNVAPVAHTSLVGCTDLTCSFDGGSSTDYDGDTLTYDWNWGDGTTHGTTETASHTFTSGGLKTVTLTVTDPDGATGVDTVVANPVAPPPNQAPTAHITGAVCTDLDCSFTGSTSSDPDSDTLTYSWNFGDTTADSTTANPTHTYAVAGAKTVILTVDDGHGHTDTDTTVVNPTLPNTAPNANITNVTCTDFECSFTGSTSTDPDGDSLTYSWDFGDNSTDATTQDATHTYAAAGAKTVTLTVDDGHGHTNSETATATPIDPDAEPVSHVAYVGSAGTAGNRLTHSVTFPAGVQAGDTMVLFFGSANIAPTYSDPAGWTLLESKTGTTAMYARAWTRTATADDTAANAKVTITSSVAAKSDISMAVYRGTHGSTPIASSASKIDNAAGAAHTSPAITSTGTTNWLVTYWADRSNTTTGWTAPPLPTTVRRAGLPSDAGSAHVIGLLADSNGPVTEGAQGGLTATANGDSSRGASFSILLKSSP